MTPINIGVLKTIIEHVPDDFKVEFDDGKTISSIDDKVEIDIGLKKVVLKKF